MFPAPRDIPVAAYSVIPPTDEVRRMFPAELLMLSGADVERIDDTLLMLFPPISRLEVAGFSGMVAPLMVVTPVKAPVFRMPLVVRSNCWLKKTLLVELMLMGPTLLMDGTLLMAYPMRFRGDEIVTLDPARRMELDDEMERAEPAWRLICE